jgi:plastocyanin
VRSYYWITIFVALSVFLPHAFADSETTWKITIKTGPSANSTSFLPPEIHARQNETIQWINNDTTAHTVTSGVLDHPAYVGKIFDSGIINPGGSFSLTITDKMWSAYYYYCKIHPWMTGKIDVGIAYLGISPDFSIETDKNSYNPDDAIRISGIVNNTNQITPLTIEIFDDERNLVYFDKTNLLSDHSFLYKLKATNSIFKASGDYKIKSMYGFPSTITDVNIHFNKTQSQRISEKTHVAKWVKNNARLWNDNKIGDKEFVNSIQFLIESGHISLPESKTSEIDETIIPIWIKEDITSWANNTSSDEDFISDLAYLSNHKIITS